MRLGLVGRILLAGALVVAFFLVEFAFLFHTIGMLRDDAARQRRAEEAVSAAQQLERLVLALESGQRGFVITGNPRFLAPWTAAQRALPAQEDVLQGVVEPALRRRAAALVALVNAYLGRWSRPVVARARHDPAGARRAVATGAGLRRVVSIRALVAGLVASESATATRYRHRVSRGETRGVAIGVVGVVGTLLLFLGIVGYFLRAAVSPLRRLSAATARIAAGALNARVPPSGAGEVGELAASFNAMADSLQHSRTELERLVRVNRTVLDSTVDGICLTDRDGALVLGNRPMLQFVTDLGLPGKGTVPEQLLAVADRFTDPEGYRAAIRRIMAAEGEATFDEFEFADSGRCFQGFTAPVQEPDGAVAGRVWTLREVTREREADRAKDEFVATVSHELRTPLTSIVGFLEMLLEGDAGPLNEEQRRFLEIVMRSAQRLMHQVADLLFMAQFDRSGVSLHPEEVRLSALVAEAVEQAAPLARQREIGLDVDAGEVPPLACDRERVGQVVDNLLSNAIKFTPPGGRVVVRSFFREGSAVVEVEDCGIGIPEQERERLFQRFYRSSSATQHAIQGTGLGLAISKAIVEAHGGSIEAEPAPGGGTVVRFALPLVAAAAAR